MKTVTSLKKSSLFIKSVSEKIENEAKDRFIRILLGMLLVYSYQFLVISLLGNLLTSKRVVRKNKGVIQTSEGTIRAGQDFSYLLIL